MSSNVQKASIPNSTTAFNVSTALIGCSLRIGLGRNARSASSSTASISIRGAQVEGLSGTFDADVLNSKTCHLGYWYLTGRYPVSLCAYIDATYQLPVPFKQSLRLSLARLKLSVASMKRFGSDLGPRSLQSASAVEHVLAVLVSGLRP